MTNNLETATAQPDRMRDVVVIGGGAAGLSAALTLARARRGTLDYKLAVSR